MRELKRAVTVKGGRGNMNKAGYDGNGGARSDLYRKGTWKYCRWEERQVRDTRAQFQRSVRCLKGFGGNNRGRSWCSCNT